MANPSQSYGIVTCCKGSHSVTSHLTQVNAPRLNPSQKGWYSFYIPQRDGRLSWSQWMVTYRDGLPSCWQSPIQVLTGLDIEQLRWCVFVVLEWRFGVSTFFKTRSRRWWQSPRRTFRRPSSSSPSPARRGVCVWTL